MTRRRRIILGVAALVTGLWLVPYLSLVHRVFPAPMPTTPAVLPASMPRYSLFTAPMTAGTPARAVALVHWGRVADFNTVQALLVGADGETIRRVDWYYGVFEREREAGTRLLSPDGTRVLLQHYGNADELDLVELASGRTRTLHTVGPQPAGVTLLAWSPDGRYVAYAVPSSIRTAQSNRDRALVVLDVTTDQTVVNVAGSGQNSSHISASWYPDSQRLLVTGLSDGARVVAVGRTVPTTLPAFDTYATVPAETNAWSPDGSVLAVTDGTSYQFVGADRFAGTVGPRGPTVPADWRLVGWQSPQRPIFLGFGAGSLERGPGVGYHPELAVARLDTGAIEVLTRFPTAADCAFGTSVCAVWDVQLATGLLATMIARPTSTDRGLFLTAPVVRVPLTVLGCVVWLVWIRSMRNAGRLGPRITGLSRVRLLNRVPVLSRETSASGR